MVLPGHAGACASATRHQFCFPWLKLFTRTWLAMVVLQALEMKIFMRSVSDFTQDSAVNKYPVNRILSCKMKGKLLCGFKNYHQGCVHLKTKIKLSACFGVCYSFSISHTFAFPDFSGLEKKTWQVPKGHIYRNKSKGKKQQHVKKPHASGCKLINCRDQEKISLSFLPPSSYVIFQPTTG